MKIPFVQCRQLAWLAGTGLLTLSGAVASADAYKIDPVHSMVIFKVSHMNVSNTYGRFDDPSGTFVTGDAASMSFDAKVMTDKIDTGNPKRDQHLKSSDFFNAKQFPEIEFKSTGVKSTGDKTFDVTGDLTLHGVTKSITIPMVMVGAAKTQMGDRAGFDSNFTVKRSDFGMNFMPGMVGDDVDLMINLEGVKQ